MKETWKLIIPEALYRELHGHLFPGDGDEHGAVICAGIAHAPSGETRLLARSLHLAVDGRDYVQGERGYRMLQAEFVRDRILDCRDESLAYLAIHNHGGMGEAAFSCDDLRSHERGYPALLDIAGGMPVGALVFTRNAVAGDIWLPCQHRINLDSAIVVGRSRVDLRPSAKGVGARRDGTYDRQSRLFGDAGQAILQELKVGVIGAGGVGSLVIEYLARLGVGHILVVDPDRVEASNLPRLTGALRRDAMTWLTQETRPEWLRRIGQRFAKPKVKVAKRIARNASRKTEVEPIFGNALDPDIARRLTDCDYLFLAADPMPVRLLFNAIVHQYLIPGFQMGAKVQVDKENGGVIDVYSTARPVTPDSGCLWCNGLIPPSRLQEEAQGAEERRRQRYVDDPTVIAPSVITLNATAAAYAVNDFLFAVTGLVLPTATSDYFRFDPRRRAFYLEQPRADADCLECGPMSHSRRARGDGARLPIHAK